MNKKIKSGYDTMYAKRLDFEHELICGFEKSIENHFTDDYIIEHVINSRNQASLDIRRAKPHVDITRFYPKNLKCVFMEGVESDEMPWLPDTVEVLLLKKNNFTKFPHRFPKNLKELYISYSKFTRLPDLRYLEHLWSIDIFTGDYKFPDRFPDSVKMITVSFSNMVISKSKFPKNLMYLYLGYRFTISKIPDLSYLKHFKELVISKDNSPLDPIIIHPKTLAMNIDIVNGRGKTIV